MAGSLAMLASSVGRLPRSVAPYCLSTRDDGEGIALVYCRSCRKSSCKLDDCLVEETKMLS